MRVAFVTTTLFGEPRNGGELCSARLLDALREAGHEVTVFGRGDAADAAQQALGAAVPAFASLPRHRQAGTLLAALASGQASTVQRLAAGGVAARLRAALAARPAPQLLVVDHLQPFAWLGAARAQLPPPLLVMHNLESDGYLEQAALARGPLARAFLQREHRRLRRLEDEALRASAAVACLSEGDAQALARRVAALGLQRPVEVLPGYPRGATTAAPARPASAHRVGLLGTWTWGPNRAALDWMLGEVLPRLPGHCRLLLAGSGLEGRTLPPRAESLGRVADVRDFYDRVDVVAVPSLAGSGVHEKAIEAIASARPVVATPHALRGLGPGLPGHVRVAADAEGFARLCACAAATGAPALAAGVQAWSAQRAERYRRVLQRCLGAAVRAAA